MGIFNEHSSSSSFTTVPLQGAAGPQGIGFKLTQNGNYDIQNKKLVNVKQGADPNDVVTKSQIQLLDNAPGDVRANKAVIYSNSGVFIPIVSIYKTRQTVLAAPMMFDY